MGVPVCYTNDMCGIRIPSCDRRKHVSCVTRRHVVLWHKKTGLLVSQDDMSSRRNVFLCHKETCLLVTQEHMSAKSCAKRRHVYCATIIHFFLCHQHTWGTKKHSFYTMYFVGSVKTYEFKNAQLLYHLRSDQFEDMRNTKHTTFIQCDLGHPDITCLQLWKFET